MFSLLFWKCRLYQQIWKYNKLLYIHMYAIVKCMMLICNDHASNPSKLSTLNIGICQEGVFWNFKCLTSYKIWLSTGRRNVIKHSITHTYTYHRTQTATNVKNTCQMGKHEHLKYTTVNNCIKKLVTKHRYNKMSIKTLSQQPVLWTQTKVRSCTYLGYSCWEWALEVPQNQDRHR